MNAEEILATYPGCEKAVAYCELILDQLVDDDGEGTSFDLMRSAVPPMPLDDWIACIREAVTGETQFDAPAVLTQLDHPNFRKYLLAKMGSL